MKKWIKPVGSVLIAGALLVGGAGVTGITGVSTAYADQDVQRNVVNVVGKGEISVKPDIAYLSIGVDTQAETAQSAQKANAEKIQKITDLLKNTWKIADKDIQSVSFYVQPNYVYNDKDGQKVKGYTAHHTLQVSYRDLSKVGKLLDDASNAGANSIDNVTFSVENRDQFEEQVIQKAMANADLKAGAIAKAAKRQLGMVLVVSQGDVGNPVVFTNAKMDSLATADAGNSTSVSPGEVKVSTQLSVQYELK
ncbi:MULTISPECIES: SIMPL domain-containing protein [Paenibacillus]|uniref:SIMPL domain-containing protein n=1 Tax=Paenibacillus albilobatus TaxID=2716884 RepID=A0A919XH47_9BACL|nr:MULTISPECIES: SIMPL domain-containing protein [Paenibacillus]GIO32732.1 SIMPL domain-containing protein [Paenibacillus albilobatus]